MLDSDIEDSSDEDGDNDEEEPKTIIDFQIHILFFFSAFRNITYIRLI